MSGKRISGFISVTSVYDGDDGVSILSANVWYALTQSRTTVPDNNAFTYDNFPTTLNAGYFVWECTKIIKSDGSTMVTGKMCLGATTDFLSGTEVYAVSTSNSTAPADSSFGTTYNKTKGSYLWTATRVQYTNGSYGYLNKKCVGYWGNDGNPGGNTATIFLYRRSATAVTSVGTLPTLYYKFSTKRLYTDEACTTLFSGQNGWYQDIPSGTNQVYVTTAVAYSTTNVDTIGNTEWVTPVQFTENGAHGVNTATIFLYKRSSSAITAHGISKSLYYKFANGKLYSDSGVSSEASASDMNSWSRSVPAADGNPCYIIQASALSNGDTDEIANTDWSTPVKYVEDGDDAETYTISLAGSSFYRNPNNEYIYVNIKGKVLKTVGKTTTEYTSLSRSDLSMYFQKTDGMTDPVPDLNSLTDGFTINGSTFASKYYNATGYSNEEVFVVVFKGKWTASIQIEKYGQNGSSIKGDTGRMYYLAGEFPKNAPYTRTSALCPVVYYGTEWWYLIADSATSSDVPSDSSAKWAKLENYGAVITDAIFVKQFAQFGSAIITGDWLISCHGTIGGIAYGGTVEDPEKYPDSNGRAAYTFFDPAYPQGFEPFLLGVKVDEVNTAAWTKVTDDFALAAGTYTIQIICDVYSEDSMSLRLYNEDTLQDEIATITSEESVTIEKTLTLSSSSKWNIRAAMGEDGDTGNIHSITIVPEDARFVPNYALDLKTGRTYQNGAFTSVGPNSKIVIENGIIKFYGKWSFPNIVMGVGVDGGAVLDFYGADGRWLYGFGPSNEHNVKTQAESLSLVYYDIDRSSDDVTSMDNASIVVLYRYIYKGVTMPYSRQLFKYLCRIHGTIYGGERVGGDDALAREMNEKIIMYGYHQPLQSSDKYGDGIVLTTGVSQNGIINRLSYLLNGTTVNELDYRGYSILQDSELNRVKNGDVYDYYTKDTYNPVRTFYFDVSNYTGSVGYDGIYQNQWWLNLCVDPRDGLEDTLVDPIYWFKLAYINENGRILNNRILYMNKSKLRYVLQAAGYDL